MSCGTFVLPSTMAPACLSRATTSASRLARNAVDVRLPNVVVSPCTAKHSFTVTGTPWSGRLRAHSGHSIRDRCRSKSLFEIAHDDRVQPVTGGFDECDVGLNQRWRSRARHPPRAVPSPSLPERSSLRICRASNSISQMKQRSGLGSRSSGNGHRQIGKPDHRRGSSQIPVNLAFRLIHNHSQNQDSIAHFESRLAAESRVIRS